MAPASSLTFSSPEPRSFWPAPRNKGSVRNQFEVRKSRTSGRSAQAWSRSKMADQMLCFFGPFGLEILGLTDRRLKGKQYEVLKCVVLDNNDVLAVLETVKSLIYQLLPPVFALISWYLEETWGNPPRRSLLYMSTVVVILPLNALVRDQIVKTCVLRGLWGHGRRCRRLDLC